MTENATSLSSDTKAMLRFEANKKSAGVAYLLWFFLGSLGAHRFYMGKTGSAVVQIVLLVLGLATLVAFGIGLIFLGILGVWLLVDLFLIGGWVKIHNLEVISSLGA